jgi:hypothetical protein
MRPSGGTLRWDLESILQKSNDNLRTVIDKISGQRSAIHAFELFHSPFPEDT